MTDMPQLVALFNAFGGGASILVAGAALAESSLETTPSPTHTFTVATAVSGIIGAVTFWGSLIAFAKLQELMSGNAIVFPGQKPFNVMVAIVVIGLGGWIVASPASAEPYWIMAAVASLLGILIVIPVGGADLPVIIAFLNSASGLAAAATGFVLGNNILIIAGSLVGASGLILTKIMCKAMNRSLGNVFFGGVGATVAAGAGEEIYEGKVKSTSAEEVAMLFDTARRGGRI